MQLHCFSYLVLFSAAPKSSRCPSQVISLLQQPWCHQRRSKPKDAKQISVDCQANPLITLFFIWDADYSHKSSITTQIKLWRSLRRQVHSSKSIKVTVCLWLCCLSQCRERLNKRYSLPLQSLSLIVLDSLISMDFMSVLSLLLTTGLTP